MKKLKKKEKIIVGVVIAAVAVVLILASVVSGNKKPPAVAVEAATLTKGNLQKTVSTTGTIGSTHVEQVTSTSAFPVWKIDVAVGNWVEEGARLCSLYNEHGATEEEKWTDIIAPVSGTITAVNAQNGMPGSGSLFTIENTNSLRIIAKIKEADLATVKSAMPVTFKTDATGDKEYTGTVQSIAPTAIKASPEVSAAGAAGSSNPEFEAYISIDSDISNLLIGMKARLDIVVEERQGVYNIDYSTLSTDENGNPCILTAVEEKDGLYTVTEVPVSTGTESDFAVEIAGDGLSDGMPIITDVSTVKAGDQVTLKTVDAAAKPEGTTNGQ